MIENNKIKLLQLTAFLVMFIIVALYFSADSRYTDVVKERCNDERFLRLTLICENN